MLVVGFVVCSQIARIASIFSDDISFLMNRLEAIEVSVFDGD